MTKDQAVAHFGTQQLLAAAIGVTQGTVSGWKRIPPWRQLQLESVTGGGLRADPDCDKYRGLHQSAVPDGAGDSATGALDEAAAA